MFHTPAHPHTLRRMFVYPPRKLPRKCLCNSLAMLSISRWTTDRLHRTCATSPIVMLSLRDRLGTALRCVCTCYHSSEAFVSSPRRWQPHHRIGVGDFGVGNFRRKSTGARKVAQFCVTRLRRYTGKAHIRKAHAYAGHTRDVANHSQEHSGNTRETLIARWHTSKNRHWHTRAQDAGAGNYSLNAYYRNS